MIEHKKLSNNDLEVIVRPNPAMPWKIIKRIYLAFALFILVIAIVLSMFNLYLAIPFYGVEVLFLGYALYISALKSSHYEKILIGEHEIKISFVNGKKIKQFKYVKAWSSFSFTAPTRTQPSEISIANQGKKILVGQRINELDRKALFNLLKTFS
jgi:uncharacterized membrane protein